MKIGTKSVLYGAHCAIIHPWFVALAWCKLYGFPFDPRLWLAFIVHDLGYIGKPNMDGPEGETHPYWGACLMGFLFGKKWFDFTLYHSRFLAKNNNEQYSKLCVADKYAFILTPRWLYLPMVNWTGEIKEYMKQCEVGKYKDMQRGDTQKEWHQSVVDYMGRWVDEHKVIKHDTWTFTSRPAVNKHGVYTIVLLALLTAFTACQKEDCKPKHIPAERLKELRDSLKRM